MAPANSSTKSFTPPASVRTKAKSEKYFSGDSLCRSSYSSLHFFQLFFLDLPPFYAEDQHLLERATSQLHDSVSQREQ
jgi:hypothetical protein